MPNLRNRVKPEKLIWSRALRKKQTESERALGTALRKASVGKYRWSAQALIGGYIADFYCAAARVVVEVDGSSHDGRERWDENRDAILFRLYKIVTIRYTVAEVMANPETVAEKVRRFCDAAPGRKKK